MHFIEQAACLGITRAKDLAKLFSLVLKGEIVSMKTVERFYNPVLIGQDAVIPMVAIKGHGFFYEPNPKKPVRRNPIVTASSALFFKFLNL